MSVISWHESTLRVLRNQEGKVQRRGVTSTKSPACLRPQRTGVRRGSVALGGAAGEQCPEGEGLRIQRQRGRERRGGWRRTAADEMGTRPRGPAVVTDGNRIQSMMGGRFWRVSSQGEGGRPAPALPGRQPGLR